MATVCDFVIASEENARFGYTEVRIGFVPAIVLTFLVRRVGEGRARELVLRGDVVTAHEAERIGLVTRAVPRAEMDAVAENLVTDLLTQNSQTAMAMCKKLIASVTGGDIRATLKQAAEMNAEARMTPECRTGINTFLQKKRMSW